MKFWPDKNLSDTNVPDVNAPDENVPDKNAAQPRKRISFTVAMAAYAVLALIAGFALDGKFRIAVWIVLGALAVKTWIARAAGW